MGKSLSITMGKKKVKEVNPEVKEKKKNKKPIEEPEEIKKPQRGLAIGDNFGWTGKLPATLLHEHCQKQKWGKVIFDMKKTSKGFIGIANLSWENPKTKEVIHIKMMPDSDIYEPKETTNEARHYVATYALFRINYVKNMKMILPKIFRDYWSDLETKRLETLKSNKEKHDAIYNCNPFTVFLEQRAKSEQLLKEKEQKQQNDLKVRKPTVNISSSNKTLTTLLNLKSTTKRQGNMNQTCPSFPKKVWANAPFIDFPSELRISIENSIKNHINWILDDDASQNNEEYLHSLVRLGFRESHIKESFQYTSSFIDSLEWLLFHIPEDDLPPFFSKSDQDSSVSLKISKNIQFEYLVNRVSQSGFDMDEILTTLEENKNDELKTCVQLTHRIVEYSPVQGDFGESQELWEQEIDGIQMIDANKIHYIENSQNRIVTISLNSRNLKQDDLLSLKLYKSDNYPNDLLGIQLIVNNNSFKLANYIKLSILRQLIQYIIKNGFLGDCYIFSIVEWLEDNVSMIIDNPGPLIQGDLSSKSSREKNQAISSKKAFKNKREKKLQPEDIDNLSKKYQLKLKSNEILNSLKKRSELPAWKKREQLVSVINSNKVTIVTGETGSGKSTQIVQFILDYLNSTGDFESSIVCTQPRRISTIGLAERISEERNDDLGKETGYIIRGENKTSNETRISFVTTGVLLRMLQSLMTSSDQNENGIFNKLQYIFIDEVHERSVDSDFLLVILKKIMKKFPKLKIILMSATISVDKFRNFFNMDLNHIHIEGRTFPIKDYYLDSILNDLDYTITTSDQIIKPKADSHFFKQGNINYDLIASLCLKIDKELSEDRNKGSILVFLPGIMEISHCIRNIEKAFDESGRKNWCLPLHSALSSIDQKRVFKIPPKDARKIVVSTNVAETSITIPDCVVVIDSGRSKTLFFDSKIHTTKLIENWCSKAEVSQRRGRSGRITNGNCYHLYTKETETGMLDQPIPEIKRTRLENLYLVVKAMGIKKVEEFLSGGLDPPDQHSLSKSKKVLTEIGALNKDNLSHLGKYLSLLPTDLLSGKLLIFGCIFGCLEVCLTLAAIRSTGSPFLNNFENRERIKQTQNSFSKGQGDLIGMANAFRQYEDLKGESKNAKKFLNENFLSYLTLKEIASTRTQYISILKDIGFVAINYNPRNTNNEGHKSLNRNNENYSIIRAIIASSFYPQIARVQLPDPKYVQSLVGAIEIDPDAKQTKFWIRNENYIDNVKNGVEASDVLPATRAFLHPSSVLFETNNVNDSNTPSNEDFTNEEDINKVRQMYKDLKPRVPGSSNAAKATFVAYGTSHYTQKLYLRDITPTSTIAALLFGGDIAYDMTSQVTSGKSSPGIVLDNWMPIRTWCKNGVLIKRLRILLDSLIEDKLSNPHYSGNGDGSTSSNDEILVVIERILNI